MLRSLADFCSLTAVSGANTNIIPPGADRFLPPVPPVFPVKDAAYSAISLAAFAAVSIAAILLGGAWPWWAVAPFWFTAIGAVIGAVYETWLLVNGQPYQLFGSKTGRAIQAIRAGNLAFVFGSTALAYALMTFSSSGNVDWLIALAGVFT